MIRDESIQLPDGALAFAQYGPDSAAAVLAIHGITSSSRAWLALARRMPQVRFIAPDLRGRGRSADLPPSAGLRTHADDLARLLDGLDIGPVPVVGHSMGAFVAVVLAASRPDLVSGLLLIDGGYPLRRPEGVADADLADAVLGPIAQRLARQFASRDEYREFWRQHPAFAGAYTPDIEVYADYDLVGQPPRMHPASTAAAIAADSLQLYGEPWFLEDLAALPGGVTLLRAPRGLLDEPGGLYPHLTVPPPLAPQLAVVDVPDVNHYTILMTEPGAGVVADALRPLLPVSP